MLNRKKRVIYKVREDRKRWKKTKRVLRFVGRKTKLLLMSIGTFFLIFGGVTGITSVINLLAAPTLRKMRKTKAEEMDEMHGIEYHEISEPSYTIEQTKEILKLKKQEFEDAMKERKYFIDNYIIPIKDGWSISFKKESETHPFDYGIKQISVKNKKITVLLEPRGVLRDGRRTPEYISKLKSGYVALLSQEILKNVKNNKVRKWLKTDIGELNKKKKDRQKEGISLIESAVQEYTNLKELKPITITGEKMSKEDIEDTIATINKIETMSGSFEDYEEHGIRKSFSLLQNEDDTEGREITRSLGK